MLRYCFCAGVEEAFDSKYDSWVDTDISWFENKVELYMYERCKTWK